MDKRSFIFYATWLDILEDMADSEQLEYFHTITAYGLDGTLPKKMSPSVRIAMKFVCRDIDAAKERNEQFLKKQRENGAKGGRPKKNPTDKTENPKNPRVISKTQKSHNVNDNVNVNVNDNVNIINPPLTPLTGVKVTKKESIITSARKVFESKFSELYNESYYWQAKDAAGMRDLLKKIKHSREQRGLPTEDADLLTSLASFIGNITDTWILQNFSVSIINSKFNEIVSQYGNNKNKKNRGIEAARLIARLAEEEAGDYGEVRR